MNLGLLGDIAIYRLGQLRARTRTARAGFALTCSKLCHVTLY